MEEIKQRKADPKTENKIKLILNLLSADNFEKKLNQLREILFPNFKTRDECFNEDIEYNKEEHQLQDEKLSEETLEFVVTNIFKKAQDEKLFCILNGQLCERLVQLELQLRDYKVLIKNMKFSKFRQNLLKECQDCFREFFKEKQFDSQAASENMNKDELK